MYLLLCFAFSFFSDCSPVSSPARPCHCTKECHTSKNRREFQSGFWLRMHLFKLQYYVFGTGLGIFRLLHNLKSDCFDCVKFGSVCVKTSRPYSDSTFLGCLSKGFWVVSDYFITTSCLVESFSRLSKSREKSEKNILLVLNMTVLNNILLFTLFLLVSYFIANHFNVCFIKKNKKLWWTCVQSCRFFIEISLWIF